MSEVTKRKFESLSDFFPKMWGVFRGPTIFMAFLKTPALLREKILLAVSTTNSCQA